MFCYLSGIGFHSPLRGEGEDCPPQKSISKSVKTKQENKSYSQSEIYGAEKGLISGKRKTASKNDQLL